MNQLSIFKTLIVAMIASVGQPTLAALNDPGMPSGASGLTTNASPSPGAQLQVEKIAAEQKQIDTSADCHKSFAGMVLQSMGNKRAAACKMATAHPECTFKCEPAAAPTPAPTAQQASNTAPATDPTAEGLYERATPPAKAKRTQPAAPTTKTQDPEEDDPPTKSKNANADDGGDGDSGGGDEGNSSGDGSPKPARKTASQDPSTSDPSQQAAQPTNKQKNNANDGGSDSTDDTDSSNAAEQAALAQCQSLGSQAANACSQGDSSSYSSNADSVQTSCKDMQDSGIKDGSSKRDLASACNDAFSNCTDFCSSSANQYSESDNWSTFNSQYQTCMGYAQKAAQMAEAAKNSIAASRGGTACDRASSMSPSSAGGGDDKLKAQRDLAAAKDQVCQADPSSQQCAALSQYASALKAVGQFGEADETKGKGQFDVADTSAVTAQPTAFEGMGAPGAAAKAGTVPNNTGGGIMGSGGGATLGNTGGAPSSPVVAALTAIADVEKGFLGGGYSQMASGINPFEQEPLVGPGSPVTEAMVNRAIALLKPDEEIPIDLKRYLPGGDLYKKNTRDPASINEFHAPDVDLWSRIHDRYREKCLLGRLVGCPEAM